MVRLDRKRSCWISPINLLRGPLTTANVQRFSEVESQLLTTGLSVNRRSRFRERRGTPPNSLSTHLSWPSATLGGAFEETPEVRSSRSLSSKIFVAGQSFIVKE